MAILLSSANTAEVKRIDIVFNLTPINCKEEYKNVVLHGEVDFLETTVMRYYFMIDARMAVDGYLTEKLERVYEENRVYLKNTYSKNNKKIEMRFIVPLIEGDENTESGGKDKKGKGNLKNIEKAYKEMEEEYKDKGEEEMPSVMFKGTVVDGVIHGRSDNIINAIEHLCEEYITKEESGHILLK